MAEHRGQGLDRAEFQVSFRSVYAILTIMIHALVGGQKAA